MKDLGQLPVQEERGWLASALCSQEGSQEKKQGRAEKNIFSIKIQNQTCYIFESMTEFTNINLWSEDIH